MNINEVALTIDNSMIYNYYRNRLVTMALSQFVYENLPDTCDRLFLEKTLLFQGKAAILKSKLTGDWLSLGYTNNSDLDIYGYPKSIRGVGIGYSNIETDEWVKIYDNPTKQSIMPMIDLYARLLWEAHQCFRMQLDKQNNPLVYEMTKNQEATYNRIDEQRRKYKTVLFLRKNSRNEDSASLLNPSVPYIGDKLMADLQSIWREALSMLGICPSGSIDKKERMTDDEVYFAREEYTVARTVRELMRKEALKELNKKYGLNVTVHPVALDTSLIIPDSASISKYGMEEDDLPVNDEV